MAFDYRPILLVLLLSHGLVVLSNGTPLYDNEAEEILDGHHDHKGFVEISKLDFDPQLKAEYLRQDI